MEVHQLRYFVAVAEAGSFTRAAERCLVAQPSLSQQIQKLERELRRPLFDRLGKRVRLTEAGEELLGRARAILSTLDETRQALDRATTPGRGRVRVGAIPTVGPYLLPPALAHFLKRYPAAQLEYREDVTAELVRALHEGDLDLAVLALPVDDPSLRAEPLLTEELLAALPMGHRLTRRRALRLDDLAAEPFILLGDMHCLTGQVTAYCRASFVPRVACRCVQLATIEQLVGLGLGVSLLPAMACPAATEGTIVCRPLREPPTRTIAVARHSHRCLGATAELFLAELAVPLRIAP